MSDAGTQFQLRPLASTDAARIAELIGDWEVVQWLSGPPHPYTINDAEQFLSRVTGADALPPVRNEAILVGGQFAGVIGIDRPFGGLNIGYWLGRAYWGRGIMSRAARVLTQDFFAMSAEPHLNSGYFSGNEASWAIQRRLGFQFVEESALFNRPHGKRMPHVFTRLTRARFETM